MSEDDDGKTVFQPSKRKTIQKKDVSTENELKQNETQKEVVSEEGLIEKTSSENKPAKKRDTKQKKPMQFDVGDVLNNVYEIRRFIAKGGMGEVYEAVNVHNMDERVAIKVMLPEFAADERVIAMFAKEAGTLTRLHHEAIVPYRLSSRDELGRPFIVTAYVDGPSLEDQFKEFSPTEEELGRLTRRLAEGLGKAHSFGAIHRDIAPDNVLLVDGNPGLPKIIDFGIAQDARAENTDATIIGDGFAGKLNYVAPEQLGEYGRNIGPWTDIYSLALTMLAVATQKHADMGGSIASAVKKRMSVPDISAIPSRFRRAFKAALQPDPSQRPQTMSAFIMLMDNRGVTEKVSTFLPLNSDVVPEIAPDVSQISDASKLAGKGKVIGVVIGAVLLIGAIFVFMMMRGTPDTPPKKEVVNTTPSIRDTKPSQPKGLTTASLASVATEIKCAWLVPDSKTNSQALNGGTAPIKFLGGAGNIPIARNDIAQSLNDLAGRNVNIDLSDVAKIDAKLCNIVDTIEGIKSPTPLIFSDEKSHILEVKKHIVGEVDGVPQEAIYTTISIEISNIDQNKSITILSIDPNGRLMPIANGRQEIQSLVNRFEGRMKEDGLIFTFPTSLDSEQKEGYGFVVITGDKGFPPNFYTETNSTGEYPVSEDWIAQFKAMARGNNWVSDIYWYSIVDEIDD